MYSERVLSHFLNPKNVGEMKDADAVGHTGNPICGDILRVYFKVKAGVIEKATFHTSGCGAAIAISSILTEIVQGKTLEEAERLTHKDFMDAIGDLPPIKEHCVQMAEKALHTALADLKSKSES